MSGGGDFSERPGRIKTPSQGADIYKAKQSLGQNFLVDQNVARKIVDQLQDESEHGTSVVEVGPGKGALSGMLLERYPKMRAVEIDQRSVAYLNDVLPSLTVLHQDVLETDWGAISEDVDSTRLSVIGNLPYYITSQILFSLIDASPLIKRAVITLQLEVAERICSPPGSKAYGILSVVSQLYGTPRLAFKIPSSAFQPKPDVTSALVVVDFPPHRPELDINECHLRTVLRAAFQQRRKMLRQSLKQILKEKEVTLPDEWGTKRPEVLGARQFVELTKIIYGPGTTPDEVAGKVWRGKLDDVARL